MENYDKCIEDKVYTAVRGMYGYGDEGGEIIDWLIEHLN